MSALPVPTRRAAVVTAAAAAAVVVLLGAAIVAGWPFPQRSDASIEDPVHAWAVRSSWAVDVAILLERIGRFAVAFWVAAAAVVVLLALRRWRLALGVALVAAVAPLVTDGIKPVVGRARPVWPDPLGLEPTFSYPSGHATAGLAVYAASGIALAVLVRDARWSWGLAIASTALGLSIGLSRVVLGVHWPSDVVGGWCVAIAVAGVVTALLLPRHAPPRGTV